ncbi:hypothetical protein WICPIJ_002380 [Wickerhamomyces pijperi]|uniref:Uncharacterized protein n=1 Tax=Wickerhamomyces pijperi TaxID=599730 RepID=A0A9P8TPV6_WICPI|nr:hypothetical protein WICPIJ_002380 [Wickerhamomyces pijperi]
MSTSNFNYNGLPTDIKYQIYQIQTESQKLEILSKVPELYQFEKKSQNVVVIFKKGHDRFIPKQFRYKYGSIDPFFVVIPNGFKSTKAASSDSQDFVKIILDSFRDQLPAIKEKLALNTFVGKPTPMLLLDFMFDVNTNNCYSTSSLYPFIYGLVKDIPHSLNIYKTQSDISKLTKSKNCDFSLFDGITEFRPLEGIDSTDISPINNTYIRLHTALMPLRNKPAVRICTFFQDCERAVREEILSLSSSLQGINIVVPSIDYEAADTEDATTLSLEKLIANIRSLSESSSLQFLEEKGERAVNMWDDAIQRAAIAQKTQTLRSFYDNLHTDCSLLKEIPTDYQRFGGRNGAHLIAEVFYHLYSDLNLPDFKDLKQHLYPWTTPKSAGEAFNQRKTNLFFKTKELNSILSNFPRYYGSVKSQFTELTILGRHWLEVAEFETKFYDDFQKARDSEDTTPEELEQLIIDFHDAKIQNESQRMVDSIFITNEDCASFKKVLHAHVTTGKYGKKILMRRAIKKRH